jgi:hypothetical protein
MEEIPLVDLGGTEWGPMDEKNMIRGLHLKLKDRCSSGG